MEICIPGRRRVFDKLSSVVNCSFNAWITHAMYTSLTKGVRRLDSVLVAIDDGHSQTKYFAMIDGEELGGSVQTFVRKIDEGSSNVRRDQGGNLISAYDVGEASEREIYVVSPDGNGFQNIVRDYHGTNANIAMIHHILHDQLFLQGREVSLVLGLPLNRFYNPNGTVRSEFVKLKKARLKDTPVVTHSERRSAVIKDVKVVAQAVAAWADCRERAIQIHDGIWDESKMAIIDIGGGTTDAVAMTVGGVIDHEPSRTIDCGMLNVYNLLTDHLRIRFPGEVLTVALMEKALKTYRIFGEDVSREISGVVSQVTEQIVSAADKLGTGRAYDAGIWVLGGGAEVFYDALKAKFPHASVHLHDEPEFANVRGMHRLSEALRA